MKKLIVWLQKYYPFLVLLFVELLLFATNYTKGTYLIGWDNLFPELNFSLNIKRSLFAVWQEYRGLGVIDGMSHAANLVHYLFLFFCSLILPNNFLRYFYVFLMHLLGGVGAYKLILTLQGQSQKSGKSKLIALFGALFYQYNLATIQMFYLPFELFVTHFAALPWALYSLLKFLNSPSKKSLLFFALVSFLATPQAHVPSIFLVYGFCLGTILLFKLIRERKRAVKLVFLVIIAVFIINSFWGLPYFYSTFTQAKTITESKNNQMGTDDIYLRNKAYGNLSSVAHLESLTLDFIQYDFLKKESAYMMQVWKDYDKQPAVLILQWLIFFIAVTGILTVLKKRQKEIYPYLAISIVIFLIMGNDIPLLNLFSAVLNKYVPYFYNVFRFVFTKFSIAFVLMYGLFFAVGLGIIINYLEKIRKDTGLLVVGSFIGLLFYLTYPSFQGNFFYRNLRVNIPQEYRETFNFFQQQDPNNRIAVMPMPWYWSWTQYNWGSIGSGFIWYGLPQALLDRAFDPWSNYNENFYWEATQALYSKNSEQLNSLLSKYQINWLIIDENIINPSSSKSLYTNQLITLLGQSDKIQLVEKFNNISIYKVDLDQNVKDYVFLDQDLPIVAPNYNWNNSDQAYLDYDTYISSLDARRYPLDANIYYPFRSLFTGRKQDELTFQVSETDNEFIFKSKILKSLVGAKLIIPPLLNEEITEVDPSDPANVTYKYPSVFLDGEQIPFDGTIANSDTTIDLSYINNGNLEIRVPKINGLYSYNSLLNNDLFTKPVINCNQFNKGLLTHETVTENNENFLRLISVGSNNCLDFGLPGFLNRLSYLITVKSRNIEGTGLLFAVINSNSERADLETYLPKYSTSEESRSTPFGRSGPPSEVIKSFFVLPAMEKDGIGYSLHFDNISIGKVKIINDLGQITVNPIPYNFLTSLKIVSPSAGQSSNLPSTGSEIEVSHPNPSYYQITLNNQQLTNNNNYLILSQSFDTQWKAYEIPITKYQILNTIYSSFPFIFGKELKDHVLVNNWENGWILDMKTLKHENIKTIEQSNNITIVILYLPQLLQYLGFGILIAGTIFLLKSRNVPKNI